MKLRIFAAITALLLVALVVGAQENSAPIEGTLVQIAASAELSEVADGAFMLTLTEANPFAVVVISSPEAGYGNYKLQDFADAFNESSVADLSALLIFEVDGEADSVEASIVASEDVVYDAEAGTLSYTLNIEGEKSAGGVNLDGLMASNVAVYVQLDEAAVLALEEASRRLTSSQTCFPGTTCR